MQIDLPAAIINNISNSDSKNSLDASDIASSKDFADAEITSNSGDDTAIDRNARDMKIKQLLNDSAELLSQSVDDNKSVDKKTDYFNVLDSNLSHIDVDSSAIDDFDGGNAQRQVTNDESFEIELKHKLNDDFVVSSNE